MPRVELTRLGPQGLTTTTGPVVSAYLFDHLQVAGDAGPCEVIERPHPLPAAEGWSAHGWSLRCPPSGPLRLTSRILLGPAPSHLHFARLRSPEGVVREQVLHAAQPTWELRSAVTAAASPSASLAGYLWLGIEHIASGWDHLAFVIALLLLAGSLREVAGLVTGFTVAHSLTLAIAVLGWVHPRAGAVEAVIAFSVALVATENAWMLGSRGRGVPIAAGIALAGATLLALAGVGTLPAAVPAGLLLFSLCHFGLLSRSAATHRWRWRAALAFAFGLVHGFGFAGVMAELELPVERLAPALLGFNAGVELGQLAVVCLVWPLLTAVARGVGESARLRCAELGSAAIAGLGLFWLTLRVFA